MLGHMVAAARGGRGDHLFDGDTNSIHPATINYEEPDPECDLDYVPNTARRPMSR